MINPAGFIMSLCQQNHEGWVGPLLLSLHYLVHTLFNIFLPDHQGEVIVFVKNVALVVAEIIGGAAFGCIDVRKIVKVEPFPLQR